MGIGKTKFLNAFCMQRSVVSTFRKHSDELEMSLGEKEKLSLRKNIHDEVVRGKGKSQTESCLTPKFIYLYKISFIFSSHLSLILLWVLVYSPV